MPPRDRALESASQSLNREWRPEQSRSRCLRRGRAEKLGGSVAEGSVAEGSVASVASVAEGSVATVA